MAHQFETGAFVGEAAWHGLGKVLETPPPTMREFLVECGLDWNVVGRPLTTTVEIVGMDDNGLCTTEKPVEVPTHQAIVRESDNSVLGVVTKDYAPLQNRDAFELFQPLVDQGLIKPEAGGSLKDGKRVWVQCRYADPVEIVPGDPIVPYVLMATGHDGGLSVRFKNTDIRVVCHNTMSASGALAKESAFEKGGGIAVRHVGDVQKNAKGALGEMERCRAQWAAQCEAWRAMAGRQFTADEARRFARNVFDDDMRKAERLIAKLRSKKAAEVTADLTKKLAELEELVAGTSKIENEFMESLETQPGGYYGAGSAYALFNAATHRVDHNRVSDKTRESRLESTWLGGGAQRRERAFAAAMELVAS